MSNLTVVDLEISSEDNSSIYLDVYLDDESVHSIAVNRTFQDFSSLQQVSSTYCYSN